MVDVVEELALDSVLDRRSRNGSCGRSYCCFSSSPDPRPPILLWGLLSGGQREFVVGQAWQER